MLTKEQVEALLALFESDQVFTDPASLLTYELDAGAEPGRPDALVLPHTTEDVERLVRWARAEGVPLTPWGSGTGYTGGAVALEGGVVVSFARMTGVLAVDPLGRQAVAQPGVIGGDLNRHLAAFDLTYPPDPASQSVCTLGGEIAENAGGPHCLKYGVTGNYILGLEVVLAGGQRVWLGGRALDPPEYDLVSLMVGSEGTLGLVTEAVVGLRRPPEGVMALTAAFDEVTTAGDAVSALTAAGLTPATIELMDGELISIVEDYLQAGLPEGAGAMLIMDVDGYPESLEAQVDGIVEVLDRFDPIEVKVAHTPEERDRLWLARRSAGPAHARVSPSEYGLDVSVPRSRLAEAISEITEISQRYGLKVTFMGHAGDGNLHPTWLYDREQPADVERVKEAKGEVVVACADLGGSIGAEHGVGVEKRDYLGAMYSPAEIGAMLEVKEVFDLQGLLNPGKIFPPDFEAPTEERPPAESVSASVIEPASAEEAAEALRALQAHRRPTFIVGGGTKWRGEIPDGALLSTAGLSDIVSLSTDDLYVTVGAGVPLFELHSTLSEHGFWVPLISPWPDATVGGILAARANGPLRALYGGVRDSLLALEVVLAGGRILRFGRPLVKDVAGYQMAKLFVGSYGTLGLVTQVSLRLRPLPLARRSLVAGAAELPQAMTLASAGLAVATLCSGAVLVPDGPGEGWRLVLTVEGHPADVTVEVNAIHRALERAGAPGLEVSGGVTGADVWRRALGASGLVVRAAVPPGELPGCLADLEEILRGERCVVDVPSGMVTLAAIDPDPARARSWLKALRERVEPLGGYAVMVAGPRPWLGEISAWGTPPESLELMQRLKRHWDPAGILNPGEFVVHRVE